jgi:type IV pilus assembly protein PilF
MLSLCLIVSAAVLGGCAEVPTAPTPDPTRAQAQDRTYFPTTGVDQHDVGRPMSDVISTSPSESRARTHVDLGMEYFNIGRGAVALDEAKAALKENSGYAPAYYLMGLVYMSLDQIALADEAFLRALNVAPGDPDFNASYGWFLCLQGRTADGMSRFERAVRNPYYRYPTRAYTNAGLCMLREKNDAAAEAQFTRALMADQSNSRAVYELAAIAYRRGDDRNAHEYLDRLHQNFPTTAQSAWLGLRVARRLGERNAQASYAEQLRTRFANSNENALMMQGKYE